MAAQIEIFARGKTEPLGNWGKLDIDTQFDIDIRNTGTTTLIDIELDADINDAQLIASIDTLIPGQTAEGIILWSGDEGKRSGKIKINAVSVG